MEYLVLTSRQTIHSTPYRPMFEDASHMQSVLLSVEVVPPKRSSGHTEGYLDTTWEYLGIISPIRCGSHVSNVVPGHLISNTDVVSNQSRVTKNGLEAEQ